jgi:hypothetical protein
MARTYVTEASATTKAPLAVASRVITDAVNYPKWFDGASNVQASKGYPEVGGVVTWTVRWGRTTWDFGGKVVESDLPGRLVIRVAPRRSHGVVTHTFEPDGTGTRYTKRVESEGPWLQRLAARAYLPRSVRREVRACVRLADEEI